MEVKTVGVACDHAGFALKKFVIQYLESKGYPYKDYGTWSDASVDYPDFGHALAEGIESGEVYPGIAICGSGEGISITLNKHQQVRAGLCWIPEIAHLIRQHNDANVLVMPGRFIDNNMAEKMNSLPQASKVVATRSVLIRFLFRNNRSAKKAIKNCLLQKKNPQSAWLWILFCNFALHYEKIKFTITDTTDFPCTLCRKS